MKKWSIGKPDVANSTSLSKKAGISSICADVLTARGIDTYEKAVSFFGSPENDEVLSNPFLLKDMRKAADIISEAVNNGDFICIYGDYDCDGITATTILYSYLECLGANVMYYINHRDDGYGLCEKGIRKLHSLDVDLIVTVDNGITSINEAELISELGMRLVITDHHQPLEELPNALAIVDPHQHDCPSIFKPLCGCAVALKLIAALDDGDYSTALEQFSDIAAIATIADIVPLTGENRQLVNLGLQYLRNTENAGLRALMELANIKDKLDSTSVAFGISPRINASGRFGHAMDAVRLLLSDDENDAKTLAEDLDSLNTSRKATEKEIMENISDYINANPKLLYNKVLVFYGEDFHHGVIGIVASRLVERFGKPVFILSKDGDFARGSARSVAGFSVFSALNYCSEVLTKFGGHFGAGGFSLAIENISEFNRMLQEYADLKCEEPPTFVISADKMLAPEELTVETISSLSLLKPFGEQNKEPIFLMRNVRVLEVIPLKAGAHTKLKLTHGKYGVYGLMFGQTTDDFPYKDGDMLDMLVTADINVYKEQKSVNVRIIDYRKTAVSQPKYFNAKYAYEKYMRNEGADPALIPRIVPTRDELGVIYRLLEKGKSVSTDSVFFKLDSSQINYCKFCLGLDIFSELGLITRDYFDDKITLLNNNRKVDLNSSFILRELNKLL